MDNLTHTFYGLALAKTGLNRMTPGATSTLLIGANLPDIDAVSLFWGKIIYLKYHRGITHSLFGAILGAAILASVVWYISSQLSKKKSRTSWRKLYLLSLIALGSHLLLDFINSYGTRLFLPFSDRWLAWDIVFIIDPWILMVLVLGLGFPFLFDLINQEIGAKPTGYSRTAVGCLILIVAYWVSKDMSHRQAIAELKQNTYPTGPPLRVGAMPEIFNPFAWEGIVETESAYHFTEVGWRVFQNRFESRNEKLYHKAEQVEIVQAARKGAQAQIFLNFARYPLFRIDPTPQGYEIFLSDLRFEFSTRRRRGFVLTTEMDKHLNIISEKFLF
jgi:inner membrane protein